MINYAHLKSQMIQLLDLLRSILYPNVFDAMEEAHSKEELEAAARRQLREILERIYREPPQYDDVIDTLFSKLPAIRDTLDTDVQAAYEGDPAATCREEVMLAYPAFEAISIFRIAHELYLMKVPMLPRMMTEYAHSLTGIDIHPGAAIGPYFFIDHRRGHRRDYRHRRARQAVPRRDPGCQKLRRQGGRHAGKGQQASSQHRQQRGHLRRGHDLRRRHLYW